MDALSDVLNLLRLDGVVYFRERFCAPWGMDMPQAPAALFHHVARGRCLLTRPERAETLRLETGDIVVVPHGSPHALIDAPDSMRRPGQDVFEAHENGRTLFDGNGEETILVCGHFAFMSGLKHPLVDELPDLIHITHAEAGRRRWLDGVIEAILIEAEAKELGSGLVANRLAEVLFVHVLRCYLAQSGPSHGHLATHSDARLSRALAYVHANVAADISLDSIAVASGMSRSAFAERFRQVMGLTPMRYVTEWRMLKARAYLAIPGRSVAETAAHVGYASEAAFARAFKSHVGVSPGRYRRSLIT